MWIWKKLIKYNFFSLFILSLLRCWLHPLVPLLFSLSLSFSFLCYREGVRAVEVLAPLHDYHRYIYLRKRTSYNGRPPPRLVYDFRIAADHVVPAHCDPPLPSSLSLSVSLYINILYPNFCKTPPVIFTEQSFPSSNDTCVYGVRHFTGCPHFFDVLEKCNEQFLFLLIHLFS